MGKLALAGAIAGAGKGISENSQNRREERVQKEMVDYEAKKRMQLERLRGNIEGGHIAQRGIIESDHIDQRGQVDADNIEWEQGHMAGREANRDARAAEQADLDRQNRLEVAEISASSRGSNQPGWMKDRWTFGVMSGGEDSGFADIPTLKDEKTGIQYTQRAGKMIEVGREDVTDAPEAALAYLQKNLDASTADAFASKYGYLPTWVMRTQ